MVAATTVDLRRKDIIDLRLQGPETSAVETGTREYVEAMSTVDPAFKWMQAHPLAGSCESAAVIPESDYREHEFVKWSRSRFGSSHWNVFYTPPIDDLSYVVTFFAPENSGRPGRQQMNLQALLFENMERATRLAARPPNFAADDSALIAIDATGRPLSLSQRAEQILRDGDELLLRDAMLTARAPHTAKLLRQAIRAAIDPASGRRPSRGVRVHRNSGKADLFVVVSPFPPSLDHISRPVPSALVRIIELDKRPEHLGEHAHLFDFSPRETEVASALLEGHSIESMSASLGLSRNTTRNHVQALFRKTGTNRQSDLIRMLDRLARQ